MNANRTKEYRLLFLGAVVVYIICHLYYINAPPNGYHHWRESDTTSIIANYYYEDMSFLEPRVNERGNTSGITGTEFPVYHYLSALLFQVFGFSHAIPRLLTLLAGCIGLWLIFRIVSLLSGPGPATFAAIILAFTPLFFFYSFKIMPDIWMLTLLLGSVYYYLKFLECNRPHQWVGSAILLIISATIKPLGLMIYLPFFYFWWTKEKRNRRGLLRLACYFVLSFALTLGWFLHARQMAEVHGTTAFYMGHMLGDYSLLTQVIFYKKLLLQWPWELWIGWHFLPVFVIGLWTGLKTKRLGPYLMWILAAYLLFTQVAAHACSHDYYTLVIVPPVAAITGHGLYRLYTDGRIYRAIAIGLVILAPIGAYIRVGSRLGETETYYQVRADVDRVIPPDALVMVRDNTNAIRLYQLNRKGWPLLRGATLATVEKYVQLGGKYIVLDQPIEEYLDSLEHYFEDTAKAIGPLYCYKLKE